MAGDANARADGPGGAALRLNVAVDVGAGLIDQWSINFTRNDASAPRSFAYATPGSPDSRIRDEDINSMASGDGVGSAGGA